MNQQDSIGAAISLSHAAAEVMSMSGHGSFMHNLGERLAAVAREQLDIASPPAEPTPPKEDVLVTPEMVCRFLGWKLPSDFQPDAGISFTRPSRDMLWPVGTNLLNYEQAEAMLLHVLGAEPSVKVLTDADALADLNGEPRQDNHSR